MSDFSRYDCIVVGCGFTGAAFARRFAELSGKRALVMEKRGHIGGNAYDCTYEDGLLVQMYGPHIFHTNDKTVFDFLSAFTQWYPYTHRVLANVYGKLIPVPFNINSLALAFETGQSARIMRKLVKNFGMNSEIGIHTLRRQTDEDLLALAEYIYENIYVSYTKKQWGYAPDNLDSEILNRVPVRISKNDSYFNDRYQGLPAKGYSALFQKMLDHPGIAVLRNSNATDNLSFRDGHIYVNGQKLKPEIPVIYTGAPDELFENRFGKLSYRAIRLEFETVCKTYFQSAGVVNYTVSEPFTRITEFKHLTGQTADYTVIAREYASDYTGDAGQIRAYPVLTAASKALYQRYQALAKTVPNLYLAGRLAEYRYYNMDEAVGRALRLADDLIFKERE